MTKYVRGIVKCVHVKPCESVATLYTMHYRGTSNYILIVVTASNELSCVLLSANSGKMMEFVYLKVLSLSNLLFLLAFTANYLHMPASYRYYYAWLCNYNTEMNVH